METKRSGIMIFSVTIMFKEGQSHSVSVSKPSSFNPHMAQKNIWIYLITFRLEHGCRLQSEVIKKIRWILDLTKLGMHNTWLAGADQVSGAPQPPTQIQQILIKPT